MTVDELSTLIVQKLARESGGSTIRWRRSLGALKVYSRYTHDHCNWDVRPSGSARDMALVERAADMIRAKHPFVEE